MKKIDIDSLDKMDLNEILDRFSLAQQEYLILRLLGSSPSQALSLGDRNQQLAYQWRLKNPHFKSVEDYLLQHEELFVSQAKDLFLKKARVNTLVVLDKVISRALEWQTLDEKERRLVIKACELVIKISKKSNGGKPTESYDEMIMRLRREERKGGKKQ